MSTSAADLAADLLPAGASLADLGSHRLRDLVRPERIFQLVHPDLPGGFPPLLSLDESPNTLPTPLTSLLDRQTALAALPGELAAHRLVTLTGAGGVGKSRLAQQVAADLIDRHPGGTWWVELAPAITEEAVLAALADGMRVTLQPHPQPEEQLIAHLRAGDATLIVLDNCEHVIDTIAPLAHRVLGGCPGVAVLATSRERLGVPGEHVWRVASLSAPKSGEVVPVDQLDTFDAVTLFIERARQARPDFIVNDRSAPHIAAICSRLDGIALAIELAAARTRSLPIDRLAAGLDHAFRLLTGGSRIVVPRQQTLLASIAWSYDLLDATDRAVVRRLAVCPSRFDVDAAEAIAASGDVQPTDVLDSLTRLVDKNLVEYDDSTGRYRMLATIRQFGLDQLAAAGELEQAQRRHAHHWAARAETIAAWPHYDVVALREALTDVMAMMDWAMAHAPDLAQQVLASIAIATFGLNRWPEAHRACDWLLASRPRSRHWSAAVASVSLSAMLMGRMDFLAVTDRGRDGWRKTRTTPPWCTTCVWDRPTPIASPATCRPARALISDATVAGDDFPVFATATGVSTYLASLGQLEELSAVCRLAGQADGALGPRDRGQRLRPCSSQR